MRLISAVFLGFALGALRCNVKNQTGDTGGVGPVRNGACPDGITVLLSDYLATQIALSSLDGITQSPSFLSTGSKMDALAFALSGDVVLPSTRPASGRVVLIDRYGTDVVTWADPVSGAVLAQLAVGTGFDSNPQDYLEIDAQRAFVTRFSSNPSAGQMPNDAGNDVLVVDTQNFAILGDIALPSVDGFPARPTRMTRVGDRVLVTLARISDDFSSTADAMLVGISTQTLAVDFTLVLPGLKSCGKAELSPDATLLALACEGALDTRGDVADISQSALVLLDASASEPSELRRIAASVLASAPLQSDVVFATNSRVLLKTQSALNSADNDRWLSFDLSHDTPTFLLEALPSASGGSQGLVYGGMLCAPGCSDLCLLADADRGVLQRARITESALVLVDPLRVEDLTGLPPRDLVAR